MRIETLARHNARLEWHRWFAWHPVYLEDAGQTAWLEVVWRRGVARGGWAEAWLEWEFASTHPQRQAVGEYMSDLLKLAERCEVEEASRDLDFAIGKAVFPEDFRSRLDPHLPRFGTSLDAAVSLMSERGWGLTWDLESVHAAGMGLQNDIGVCAYVWLDHMTNEKSFVMSPPVDSFGEAVKWLPRLICSAALRARAALIPDGAPEAPPKVRTLK